MKMKRIFAWIGIILLVGMYAVTLVFALGKSPFFQTMFLASIAATVIVPVLLYGILMMSGVLKNKKSEMIDSVIFDVGYVLADFPLREYARKAGVSEENINLFSKKLFGTPLWREFDLGNKTKEEVIDAMVAEMPEHEGDIRRILPAAFTSICPFPYTESWLQSLKAKGYKLYILSNWPEFAYEMHKDGALAFEQMMDGAVWS
ncbi:MAG: HAD family hydrolase, partial [Lachnospiraceae bacterium]